MGDINTKSKAHVRVRNFVDWIRPKDTTRETIINQAKNIRKNIKKKAEQDGLTVVSTPNSGSFAKKTGLRRHYKGNSEVEGQDVDLPFVVKPETKEGEELDELLNRFYKYAEACYPDTEKKRTKSSIKLKFGNKIDYELVPMLATDNQEKQIIIRANGERIETSVQKHIDFIKKRTNESNDLEGRVKFNECVRLLKWWRDFQANDSYYLNGDDSPPSILIDLLSAKAFDQMSVKKTYTETLAQWCAYLANIVRNKGFVYFTDYTSTPRKDPHVTWVVVDPVNKDNNVVKNWNDVKVNELAKWFEQARDVWPRAIRHDEEGSNNESLENLVKLFGNPFRNNCEE